MRVEFWHIFILFFEFGLFSDLTLFCSFFKSFWAEIIEYLFTESRCNTISSWIGSFFPLYIGKSMRLVCQEFICSYFIGSKWIKHEYFWFELRNLTILWLLWFFLDRFCLVLACFSQSQEFLVIGFIFRFISRGFDVILICFLKRILRIEDRCSQSFLSFIHTFNSFKRSKRFMILHPRIIDLLFIFDRILLNILMWMSINFRLFWLEFRLN